MQDSASTFYINSTTVSSIHVSGVMARASRPEDLKFKTFADGYINIHPGSVCANLGTFETPYLVFQEKVGI